MNCQPKGSMCMRCSNGSAACGQLDFSSMPVIKVYPDGVKAVKCADHQRTRADRRRISCGAPAPAALQEGEGLPCVH